MLQLKFLQATTKTRYSQIKQTNKQTNKKSIPQTSRELANGYLEPRARIWVVNYLPLGSDSLQPQGL